MKRAIAIATAMSALAGSVFAGGVPARAAVSAAWIYYDSCGATCQSVDLWRQRVDGSDRQLVIQGAVQVTTYGRVSKGTSNIPRDFDLSADGNILVHLEPQPDGGKELVKYDLRDGSRQVVVPAGNLSTPAISPKGDKIAFIKNRNLDFITLSSGKVTRVPGVGFAGSPSWSFDGRYLAHADISGGGFLYRYDTKKPSSRAQGFPGPHGNMIQVGANFAGTDGFAFTAKGFVFDAEWVYSSFLGGTKKGLPKNGLRYAKDPKHLPGQLLAASGSQPLTSPAKGHDAVLTYSVTRFGSLTIANYLQELPSGRPIRLAAPTTFWAVEYREGGPQLLPALSNG